MEWNGEVNHCSLPPGAKYDYSSRSNMKTNLWDLIPCFELSATKFIILNWVEQYYAKQNGTQVMSLILVEEIAVFTQEA